MLTPRHWLVIATPTKTVAWFSRFFVPGYLRPPPSLVGSKCGCHERTVLNATEAAYPPRAALATTRSRVCHLLLAEGALVEALSRRANARSIPAVQIQNSEAIAY